MFTIKVVVEAAIMFVWKTLLEKKKKLRKQTTQAQTKTRSFRKIQ